MSMRAMQETTFLILTALAQRPQHGYGIIQDVGRISGDRVALRAGTLYGALERLDADGLISVDREEVADGRLRRYYRLTDEGSGRLAEEARRLQENAATALRRLGAQRLGSRGLGAQCPGLAGGATALRRLGAQRLGAQRLGTRDLGTRDLGAWGLGLAGGAA